MAVRPRVYTYARVVEALLKADPTSTSVSVSLHGPAYVPNSSHSTASDLRSELSGGNYRRKPLQGRELLFDVATQRIQFKTAGLAWPLFTGAPRWAVVRASDAATPPGLLAWVDLGQGLQVFNSTFSLAWTNDIMFEVEGAAYDG